MGIHSGHRERMKQRFRETGFDGFSDVNALELLLFYAIPRQDTNPIAHALLDRFGSFHGVIDAHYEDLLKVARAPRKQVLTDTALETLSIIAYKQPVTKTEIEKIRGVKCDHAINKLVEYNLVQELGRLDAPGRPILFGTTEEFLRNFGVESTEDLPVINPVKLEDFKAEAEEEIQLRLNV